MSSNPEPHAFWDGMRGRVFSRKGMWRRDGGGVISHGYAMMDDLVGETSYMQVVLLNALGRLPERRLADWFEAAHICLSWPDPRIWCNQVGALIGTTRGTAVAATTVGILAADSTAYGIYPLMEGVRVIQAAYQRQEAGATPGEIVAELCARHGGKPQIMGYARPVAKGDERVPALERVAARLGFETGSHLRLALAIQEILLADHDESMNVNGYMSAFLSDQGFTPEEVYRACVFLVASGVTACYVDACDRPAGAFMPMRCEDIAYAGPPLRVVPEK